MLGVCRFSYPQSLKCLKARYATVKNLHYAPSAELDEIDLTQNDFFLSIVRAKPSLRDTRSYLASFSQPNAEAPRAGKYDYNAHLSSAVIGTRNISHPNPLTKNESAFISSILNPVYRRTALVKLQGPFTDRQLDSIARGMVYLEKLGLVSVIVVELDNWVKGEEGEKTSVMEETIRVVSSLEKQGARARPLLSAMVRLGPKPGDIISGENEARILEAHTHFSDLLPIQSALSAGEIPVVPPLALDSFCRSVRINSDDVIGALSRGMVESAKGRKLNTSLDSGNANNVDLTPMRLMIINREGGVPSYARSGLPHLLINLTAECSYINETFHDSWKSSSPTSLSNLRLARTCLSFMPASSSAIMVSHRSSRSLIANLITNRPEVSSSLPHALLQGNGKLTADTPTILRRGLPIRVIRSISDLDKQKLKRLLEQSFKRNLDEKSYYGRLQEFLDFAIIAGDYAGAVIVTSESATGSSMEPITYLDKFAVLPSQQGDGTVDFLWVALHDESYGLGLSYSVNPNGGKQGKGEGRDLVWRSRADNPVNKWYFERSSGHLKLGDWILFWCDAEKKLQLEQAQRGKDRLSYLESWEEGRLNHWTRTVSAIPSCWKPCEGAINSKYL